MFRKMFSILIVVSFLLTACGRMSPEEAQIAIESAVAQALTEAPASVTKVVVTATPEPTATRTATLPPTSTPNLALTTIAEQSAQIAALQTQMAQPVTASELGSTVTVETVTPTPEATEDGEVAETSPTVQPTPENIQIFMLEDNGGIEDGQNFLYEARDALMSGLSERGVSVQWTDSSQSGNPSSTQCRLALYHISVFDLNILGDEDAAWDCLQKLLKVNPDMKWVLYPIAPRSNTNVAKYIKKLKENGYIEHIQWEYCHKEDFDCLVNQAYEFVPEVYK